MRSKKLIFNLTNKDHKTLIQSITEMIDNNEDKRDYLEDLYDKINNHGEIIEPKKPRNIYKEFFKQLH